MAISNESIVDKMMQELQNAKRKKGQSDSMREHVRAVRSLCDLILDDTNETNVSQQQEVKAMMGSTDIHSVSTNHKTDNQPIVQDDGEANGKSIFDF